MKKRDFVIYAGCILFVLLSYFCFRGAKIHGTSMEPTLHKKDILLVERVSPKSHYDRYDIIIFRTGNMFSRKFIKRIIGLPGETVRISDGKIYINGSALDESYGQGTNCPADMEEKTLTLGRNEYFVLGDNRENSLDSRYDAIGPVSADKIVGRAWCRIWPIKIFH